MEVVSQEFHESSSILPMISRLYHKNWVHDRKEFSNAPLRHFHQSFNGWALTCIEKYFIVEIIFQSFILSRNAFSETLWLKTFTQLLSYSFPKQRVGSSIVNKHNKWASNGLKCEI